MSRAIDLRLKPSNSAKAGGELAVYTYEVDNSGPYADMSESVYLAFDVAGCHFSSQLTSDEARVLANQLLQVADAGDEARAARVADEERQASFDEISAELRDADDRGGSTGCYYAHPDVHYVPADKMEAKVRELNEAGVQRFMVLAEPTFEAAA